MIWFIRILGLITVAILTCMWLDKQSSYTCMDDVESFQNNTKSHIEKDKLSPVVLKSISLPTTIEQILKKKKVGAIEQIEKKSKIDKKLKILKKVELDSIPIKEIHETSVTTDVDETSVTTDVDKTSVTTDVDETSVTTDVDETSVTTDVPIRQYDETYAYYKKPTSQTNKEKEEAGYVYLPSRFWSIPQKRPPACTPSVKPKVCPVYTDGVPDGALEWKLTARERQVRRSSNRPPNAQHLRNSKNRYYYPGYYAQGDTYKHSC